MVLDEEEYENIECADLESEMKRDKIVLALVEDDAISTDFYRALCNMEWRKRGFISEEERTIYRLKGYRDLDVWSCSWRHAGAIIAELRNMHYNKTEDYMDFYCAGGEGTVTNLVKECFNRMGWEPIG